MVRRKKTYFTPGLIDPISERFHVLQNTHIRWEDQNICLANDRGDLLACLLKLG